MKKTLPISSSEITADSSSRFWAKVDKTDACWIWKSYILPNGYPRFWLVNRPVYAYRFSYVSTKGEIPKGLEIDHLCRNPRCVNPDHLEAVTSRVNVLRSNNICARSHRQKQERLARMA